MAVKSWSNFHSRTNFDFSMGIPSVFHGYDGNRRILCGVTAEALKLCDPQLPHTGLIPAEEFLKAFERLIVKIHDTARAKYTKGKFESTGEIEILVKRYDLLFR